MKKYFLILLIICSYKIKGQTNLNLVDLISAEMKYWQMRAKLVGDDHNINTYDGFIPIGSQN